MRSYLLIRYLLAGSSSRGVGNLFRLAKHKESKIRRHVAENADCPRELLESLADDTHPDVRMAVALNPHTDIKTQVRLSKDENPDVRFWIASASCMPPNILISLAQDDNPYVQDRAQQTLRRLNYDCRRVIDGR